MKVYKIFPKHWRKRADADILVFHIWFNIGINSIVSLNVLQLDRIKQVEIRRNCYYSTAETANAVHVLQLQSYNFSFIDNTSFSMRKKVYIILQKFYEPEAECQRADLQF